ncbi:hypothetical protein S83_063135, partial [Arachis hypogaea]
FQEGRDIWLCLGSCLLLPGRWFSIPLPLWSLSLIIVHRRYCSAPPRVSRSLVGDLAYCANGDVWHLSDGAYETTTLLKDAGSGVGLASQSQVQQFKEAIGRRDWLRRRKQLKLRFGSVVPISGSDFVREVSQAPSDVWVVVILYKDGLLYFIFDIAECGILMQCIEEFVTRYP